MSCSDEHNKQSLADQVVSYEAAQSPPVEEMIAGVDWSVHSPGEVSSIVTTSSSAKRSECEASILFYMPLNIAAQLMVRNLNTALPDNGKLDPAQPKAASMRVLYRVDLSDERKSIVSLTNVSVPKVTDADQADDPTHADERK